MEILLVFFIGLITGSFLNAVIFRLHAQESLWGRSRCRTCLKTLPWYLNIPIASFVIVRGRCKFCKKKISWQYPLVECAAGVLFVITYLQATGYNPHVFTYSNLLFFFRNSIFLSFLIVIFVYDLRWYYILDAVTLPAGIIASIANIALGIHWMSLLLGAIIGGGFFLIQFVISRGKWIGGGDIRLGVVMGLMLGAKFVLIALFVAYVTGALVSIFFILFGYKSFSSRIPFGTFLAFGTLTALLYGEWLFLQYAAFI